MNLLNISIDDVSPHPKSSIAVLDRCYDILEEFPDTKFTLFIPAAYWRTIGDTATESPLILSEFEPFCKKLAELPRSSFELCYHGLYHGIPFKTNNDEFANVTYEHALSLLELMLKIVSEAGLKELFKPIFRPPAWRMCPSAFEAAIAKGITTFALSSDDYVKPAYVGYEQNVRRVMYTASPPYKQLVLTKKTEIVYHACEWDQSYLSKEQTASLMDFLRKNRNEYDFRFIDDLAEE